MADARLLKAAYLLQLILEGKLPNKENKDVKSAYDVLMEIIREKQNEKY